MNRSLLLLCVGLLVVANPVYGQSVSAKKIVTIYRFEFDPQISNPDLRGRIEIACKNTLQVLCPEVAIRNDLGYFDPALEETERIRLVHSIDALVDELSRPPDDRTLARLNRAVATDYLLLASVGFRPESAAAAYTLSYRFYRLIDLATFEDQFSWGADAVEINDLKIAMRRGLRAVAICGTTDTRSDTRTDLYRELDELIATEIALPDDTLVRARIAREVTPDPVLYGLYLSRKVSLLEDRLTGAVRDEKVGLIPYYREQLLATYDAVLALYPHSALIQESYRKRRAAVDKL